MIRVLIVDDSSIQQELLTHVLTKDPDIEIIGTAKNGIEAIALVDKLKPDIVTMDINMPKMDGIEATRKIMLTHPLPIIIISGSGNPLERAIAFEAVSAGAITIVEKLNFVKDNVQEFIRTVKLMSEIKVIKRHIHTNNIIKKENKNNLEKNKTIAIPKQISIVAIGASTGGPMALQEILIEVSKAENFPPILIVQHISPGFIIGLIEWLHQTTKLPIKMATHSESVTGNQVYVSPDNYHMGIDSLNRINLTRGNPENGHIPSVSFLFRSVAKSMGTKALGILLTGMGRDGADGLKEMRDSGAFTIAQNQESSIVFGMPGEAVALNAACLQLPPLKIGKVINGTLEK